MSIQKEEITILNNEAKSQFEAHVQGHIAVTEYRIVKNRVIFTHTEVPVGLEGQGIASKLAKAALDFAKQGELVVMPLCPFIAGYIHRHPEYKPLVLPGFRY